MDVEAQSYDLLEHLQIWMPLCNENPSLQECPSPLPLELSLFQKKYLDVNSLPLSESQSVTTNGECTFRPKFLGQIWGYPKYPKFFGVTPDLPQISVVNLGQLQKE